MEVQKSCNIEIAIDIHVGMHDKTILTIPTGEPLKLPKDFQLELLVPNDIKVCKLLAICDPYLPMTIVGGEYSLHLLSFDLDTRLKLKVDGDKYEVYFWTSLGNLLQAYAIECINDCKISSEQIVIARQICPRGTQWRLHVGDTIVGRKIIDINFPNVYLLADGHIGYCTYMILGDD